MFDTRALKDSSGDAMQKCFLPFSYGPRDCLGQRFGMMEVRSHRLQAIPSLHRQLESN